ncbi:hypothetical protein DVP62_17365 [Yersinia enterocolitica]|nr:hypothetical protein [Yersinia enterocolitica]EKN6262884.1 hypothetical protein [Yersinia enterocolitica]EKN6369502.1 hypothetical protein [Yersinia enterocolitica]
MNPWVLARLLIEGIKMTMKYSTVKCTKSTNTANFAEGKSYRMFHASHDDVIETTDGRAFGITAQLEHATSHGNFQFQLVGEYNRDE